MNIHKKAFIITFIVVAAIIIVAAVTPNTNQRAWKNASLSWYALHLANGQTYYGRLRAITDTALTLEDAHYFEVYETNGGQAATSTSFAMKPSPQTVYNLVQQGSDQNMATDHTLFFNRSAVLYWEKLDADAGVVQNIEAAKANH